MASTIARTMVLCPLCGSDRLIPLTFARNQCGDANRGRIKEPQRQVAKCIGCGERIYSQVFARLWRPGDDGSAGHEELSRHFG